MSAGSPRPADPAGPRETEAGAQPGDAPRVRRRMAFRPSLGARLSLAFLLASVVGVGLAALLAHMVTVREFERFFIDRSRSEFLAAVTDHYQQQGGWEGVGRRMVPPIGPGGQPRPPGFALVDAEGRVLLPAAPYRRGQRLTAAELARGLPVEAAGRRVGTVLDAARRPTLSDREVQYLQSTDRALALAALGAVLAALVLGLAMARGLSRPLRDLTAAARRMARGELQQTVPVRSDDELGELSRAFNQMSQALTRANQARRDMTADIAHDLRTPLTVISGYLEAMQEGVLEPTPARLAALHAEAQHLKHLVEDLRTLSLADAGDLVIRPQAIEVGPLLRRLEAAYGPQAERAGIALGIDLEPDLPTLLADPERMVQVLANLIANALQHSPAGGRITLSAGAEAEGIVLSVTDTGVGMSAEVLDRIFDRFYRADPARAGGGEASGLGLAIARSLVEAQGGRIEARSAGPGLGSAFRIHLPCRDGTGERQPRHAVGP